MKEPISILKKSMDALEEQLLRCKNEAIDFHQRYVASACRAEKLEIQIEDLQKAINTLEGKDGSKSKKSK